MQERKVKDQGWGTILPDVVFWHQNLLCWQGHNCWLLVRYFGWFSEFPIAQASHFTKWGKNFSPSPGVGMGYVEICGTLITLLHRKYLHPPNEFFPLEVGDGLKLAELATQFLGRTCQGGLRYEGSWQLLNGFALSHLNNSDHRSGF